MLMGIVQKPTLTSCFSRDAFVETPIFSQTMINSRFELNTRFLNFGDKTIADSDTWAKTIFKIHSPLELLKKFSKSIAACTRYKCRWILHIKEGSSRLQIVHSTKGSKNQHKTLELCEFSTGYLWNFIIYTAAGSDITTYIGEPDNQCKELKDCQQTSRALRQPSYKAWMHNYNSPSLWSILRENWGQSHRHTQPKYKAYPTASKIQEASCCWMQWDHGYEMGRQDRMPFITTFLENTVQIYSGAPKFWNQNVLSSTT